MINVSPTERRFLSDIKKVVLIRIAETLGSAPRESGCFMLVKETAVLGTIGGGQLEFVAIAKAKELLKANKNKESLIDFKLGPETGQCCGGLVKLEFEMISSEEAKCLLHEKIEKIESSPKIYIFGAGHVGKALSRQLLELPVPTLLIDNRMEMFKDLDPSQKFKCTPIPEVEIRESVPGSAYVIATHDHALDFLLVKEALLRKDASYIGMIGSKTKRCVLGSWLKKQGNFSLKEVTTPIGVSFMRNPIVDKRPEIIAAFVVPEVIFSINQFNLNKKSRLGL